MHSDWKGPFRRRLQKKASERGKRMAKRRWELDRQRRDKLATLAAEKFPTAIARRIVVIDNETTVQEAVIWNFESARSWRRKERAVLSHDHRTSTSRRDR